jgi:hypothetical protein
VDGAGIGSEAFRAANALLVRTYFNPDEHWQCLELAHRVAFGYRIRVHNRMKWFCCGNGSPHVTASCWLQLWAPYMGVAAGSVKLPPSLHLCCSLQYSGSAPLGYAMVYGKQFMPTLHFASRTMILANEPI